jgi:ubiquinone/menaquinone biosynthesis C-methylase UbiE
MPSAMINMRATALTKVRYDRIARIFDSLEFLMESRAKPWRRHLWDKVRPGKILEVGIGTGKNMPFYPQGTEIFGVDLSDGMLMQAHKRALRNSIIIDLREMDVQALGFPDNSFDAAVATFVFCSVPDPIQGMQELARVVKPDGNIHLLEHVRLDSPFLGWFMDLVNPLVVRMVGANINRRTVENVQMAGLVLESVENMTANGLVKLINARPNRQTV